MAGRATGDRGAYANRPFARQRGVHRRAREEDGTDAQATQASAEAAGSGEFGIVSPEFAPEVYGAWGRSCPLSTWESMMKCLEILNFSSLIRNCGIIRNLWYLDLWTPIHSHQLPACRGFVVAFDRASLAVTSVVKNDGVVARLCGDEDEPLSGMIFGWQMVLSDNLDNSLSLSPEIAQSIAQHKLDKSRLASSELETSSLNVEYRLFAPNSVDDEIYFSLISNTGSVLTKLRGDRQGIMMLEII